MIETLDDLESLFSAYEADCDVPSLWTPAHVGSRLVEAYRVLEFTGSRPGPRSHANGWPAMVTDWEGFNASEIADIQQSIVERRREDAKRERPRFSVLDQSMSDEALAWPMRYLASVPLQADALQLWAFMTARGWNIEKYLAARMKLARSMAQGMSERENARRQALRSEIIKRNTAWANERLPNARDRERAAAIKENARIKCQREIDGYDLRSITYQPKDGLPNRALSRTNLDRQRWLAMDRIAKGLHRDGVKVR